MKIYQYVHYLYVALSALFLYDAYAKYATSQNYYISLAMASVALFMFFFRRHFINKIKKENTQTSKQSDFSQK